MSNALGCLVPKIFLFVSRLFKCLGVLVAVLLLATVAEVRVLLRCSVPASPIIPTPVVSCEVFLLVLRWEELVSLLHRERSLMPEKLVKHDSSFV